MQEAQPNLPPGAVVTQMLQARLVAQGIGAAATFRFADHLAAGPKSAEELAGLSGTHAPAVYRLLRMLAMAGLFIEGDDGRFANTPLSEALREGVPGSVRGLALMISSEFHVKAWFGLPHSVRTGASGFEQIHGAPVWSYLRDHPEDGAIFNGAMTAYTEVTANAALAACDFSGIGTLVDVGGGQGAFLAAILSKYPGMRGVLFDLPEVASGEILKASGVADRSRVEGGDFFKGVPSGDAYILKHIIHDWSDEDAVKILSSVARAAAPGSRVLLVEAVLKPRGEPDPGKIIDIEMLVMTNGGRERTADEFADLFRRAGLTPGRVIPTEAPVFILEATRP